MNGHLLLLTEFTIKPGCLEEFKRLVRTEFVPHFRQAEPGLQRYTWYESADGTKAYEQSWYADAADFVEHMKAALVSERFARLLQTCTVSRVELFGEADESVRRFLADHGLTVQSYFAGFIRQAGG